MDAECRDARDADPNLKDLGGFCHTTQTCFFANPSLAPVNKSTTFVLRDGEGFIVHGEVSSVADCFDDSDTVRVYNCGGAMSFIDSYSYDELSSITTKNKTLSGGNCNVDVTYQITLD